MIFAGISNQCCQVIDLRRAHSLLRIRIHERKKSSVRCFGKNGDAADDGRQDQKREPGQEKALESKWRRCRERSNLPDESAAKEHPEAPENHIVRRFLIVAHRVQSHGHMRLAIIAAEIVLECTVCRESVLRKYLIAYPAFLVFVELAVVGTRWSIEGHLVFLLTKKHA